MLKTRQTNLESAIPLAILPSIALGLVNGLYFPLVLSNPGLYWALDVLQFVLVPALGFWFLTRQKIRPGDYGFHSLGMGNSWAENFGLIVFVTFFYWLSFDPINDFLYRFFGDSSAPIPFSHALPETQPWRELLIIYAALTAALIEEPVFRSLPWLYLEKRLRSPEWPYVLSSSLLFSLVHWEQGIPTTVAACFLGFVAALLYISIRNIWPFVIAHFLVDIWEFHGL